MSSHQFTQQPKLNIYWDKRILAITALGVISGLPWSLTHTTLGYWLTTEGISMKTIGLFALTSLPYAFKFLWAPLFDLYHAPWLRRGRSGWMFLSQLGLLTSLVAMSMLKPQQDVALIALLALWTSFFSASQDIAVDGWRVQVLEDDEQGVGASVATLGYRIGMYISSAGALLMSAYLPWKWIYLSLAVLVGLGTLVSLYTASKKMMGYLTPKLSLNLSKSTWWLSLVTTLLLLLPFLLILVKGPLDQYLQIEAEKLTSIKTLVKYCAASIIVLIGIGFIFSTKEKPTQNGWLSQAKERWGKQWLIILLFVCVFRLGDHLLGLFLFPSLSELGFSAIEIATVAKSWGLVATILGTLLGGWLVYRVGLMKVMVIAGVAQALSNLTLSAQALLGHSLSFLYVSIGVQDLALGMVNATFVAYISSLCDRRYAATHFAFLSALSSVLKTFIQAGSGYLVEWCKLTYGLQGGWAAYFGLTSVLALPGLILLFILIRAQSNTAQQVIE